ncbi:MAG: YkgJ family cysteine cluster protein [Promethearchaeota archaeon]
MADLKEIRFSCTRCGNCCTDINTLVNVTFLDISRIIKSLKLDLKESLDIFGFYVHKKGLTQETLRKMVVSPIETEKGPAFIGIMKNNQGTCFFYDNKNKKCLIYSLRPMFCRSFPFSFKLSNNEKNSGEKKFLISFTVKAKEYCPGIGNDAPFIDLEHWQDLAQRILIELKENNKFNQNWNKNVKNKRFSPSAKNFIELIMKLSED